MAFDIVAAFTAIPKGKKDDGCVDRLHHRYSVVLFVTFAVIVSASQYVGSPITCWVPAEFGGGWQAYTNSYCYIKNTYFLPYEDEIPHHWEPEKRSEIIYYQWVPFILIAQAMFFYFPSVFWHGLNQKGGVDSDNILAAAHTFNRAERMDTREKTLTLIVNQIHRFLGAKRTKPGKYSPSGVMFIGKHFGNYLITLYIISKLLYIANVFLQMYFLGVIFKTNFFSFGVDSLTRTYDDDDATFINNTVFPKVTMCDFWIRRLGNEQRYTVQCALPINLYIEKMYVILWFWMLFLVAVTTLDLLTWILRTALSEDKLRYVTKHLKNMNRLNTNHQKNMCGDFVYKYLKQDGVFLLRMIGHNNNHITVSEIVAALWDHWRDVHHDTDADPRPSKLDEVDNPDDDDTTPMIPNNRPRNPPPPPPPSQKPPLPPKPPVTPSAPVPPTGPEKPPIEELEMV